MGKRKKEAQEQGSTSQNSRVKGTITRGLNKKLEREIEFSFYAPLSSRVAIAGTFNRWNPAAFRLKKGKDGTWRGKLYLQEGRYEYKVVVDGNWENDQKQCELVPNGQGGCNCILNVG